MEEDEEEKRSDTPERNDKDDLDKEDVTTNSKEEQNPEEKEEDTAEVEGAHVELEPCKGSRAENREGEDDRVPKKVDGREGSVTSSDVDLLSPKRHLERQASYLDPNASSHVYVFTSQLLSCVFFSLHEVILFNHFGCLDLVYSLLIAGEAIKHFVHAMPRPLYQSSQHRNHLTSYIIDGTSWPQCPTVMFSENI